MKVRMEELKEAVNAVSTMSNDIVMQVNNNKGTLISSNVKSGMRVMSLFEANDSSNTEIYLSKELKDSVNALSLYSDEMKIDVKEGSIMCSTSNAKVCLATLQEKPADISSSKGLAHYLIDGKEFTYAMNQVSKGGLIHIFVCEDKLYLCNFNPSLILISEVPIQQAQHMNVSKIKIDKKKNEIENSNEIDDSICEMFNKTVLGISPERNGYLISISKELWQKIAPICRKEAFCLNVCENGIQLMWQMLSIEIPLSYNKMTWEAFEKIQALSKKDETVRSFTVKGKEIEDALSVAMLGGEKEVVFKCENGLVSVYTPNADVTLSIKTKMSDFSAVYVGEQLQVFFAMNRDDCDITLSDIEGFDNAKIFIVNTSKEYKHCYEDGTEKVNVVKTCFISMPINK